MVVTAIESALMRHMDPEIFKSKSLPLVIGETVDVEYLDHGLAQSGYEKVDMVEQQGQFARRGSIVDVFSPMYDHPIRMELFDDEVDSLRFLMLGHKNPLKNWNHASSSLVVN